MKGFTGHGIRLFRENRDHPTQDGRRSTRRFGGTFYLWLFSMLLIVMIPLIGSEWIRERASALLLEERMESAAFGPTPEIPVSIRKLLSSAWVVKP